MRTFISKKLSQDFPNQEAQDKFVKDFKDWQDEGRPCFYRRFGKCVTTAVPKGHDFEFLWHVHLIPDEEDDLERWQLKLMSRNDSVRCSRSSDSLLFFAEYNGEFLLIRKTDHSMMRAPLDRLKATCIVADSWVAALRK